MSWVHVMGPWGWGWVRVGKVDLVVDVVEDVCLIGDWWGLCGVFFKECKVLKVFI